MADMVPAKNTGLLRKVGSNFLVYGITLIIVCMFIYFIYNYIYGTPTFQANLIMAGQIKANDASGGAYNVKIPNIYEGGDFTTNFWIYINGYTYNNNKRKHLLEIGHQNTTTTNGDKNFSTIVIALGATTPTLLVRTHTQTSDPIKASDNYGIMDCDVSGANCTGGNMKVFGFDASGGKKFQQLTDKNLLSGNTMMDNTLYSGDVTSFFKPYDVSGGAFVDENNPLFTSTNTCDVKALALQKWVNISTVMSGKTLDIYLDGKLVKTCVFKNYFKVDSTGAVASYLQYGGFDGYFSRLQVFNSVLTPDDIYKNYLAGPTGSSPTNDPGSFFKYLFTG